MSDLSFLIENQNEVQIDESFLEKCQQQSSGESKMAPAAASKVTSSREIKLNRNKNLISTKKKAGSPRSFNLPSREGEESENLAKLAMRVEALEENQKRMEKRIGIEFFQLKEEVQRRNQEQNEQFEEVRRIRGGLNDTKRNIAELLTMISKRK